MDWTIFLAVCAIIVMIILFILKQFFDWKKEIETRLNNIDVENARKEEQIKFLFDLKYNPFEKGEKEK